MGGGRGLIRLLYHTADLVLSKILKVLYGNKDGLQVGN